MEEEEEEDIKPFSSDNVPDCSIYLTDKKRRRRPPSRRKPKTNGSPQATNNWQNRGYDQYKQQYPGAGGVGGLGSPGCTVEVWANSSRSGRISSDMFPGGGVGSDGDVRCSVVFKGNPGDVVIVGFDSYRLR